ncbi:hypothetical protein CK203_095698 [Vitis vinifera]|uniref:Reverse transcriptase RNase H-like domain-containing protein n=1 Tax=Vitis vinifera TaxID=29760 RepID=A0A438F0A4_VITVI|nr:hypothetical protein CK203_095698 [Vitis vinifera]
MGPYRMALPQLKELRRQFNEFPDTRFIIPSKAPYDVSILFQNKYDGSLRMCMDCWALNKVEEQVPLFRSLSTCLINLVPQLRSFLSLVNYYQRFIKGYSIRATPLINLPKKNKTWESDEKCQQDFEDLNKVVTKKRCWHYPTIPRCLRHYLLGSHFVMKTNNIATSYFQTQKKLSPKQTRWKNFLTEFDYTLEYKSGSANHVVNTLSRKTKLATMTSHAGPSKGGVANMIQWLRASFPWPMREKLSGSMWTKTYFTLKGDDSTCPSEGT